MQQSPKRSNGGRLGGQPAQTLDAGCGHGTRRGVAQQTAQLVREALGFEAEIRTVSWLTPEANPLLVLQQQPDSRAVSGAYQQVKPAADYCSYQNFYLQII